MKPQLKIDYANYEISAYRYEAPCMGYMHTHAQMEFNLMEKGRAVYIINGQHLQIPANRFFFFWGVSPHQLVEVSPDCIWRVIHFPLGPFLEFPLISRLKKQILNNSVVFSEENSRENGDYLLFDRWISLPLTDETAKQSLSLELQARITREEFRHQSDAQTPVPAPQPSHSFVKVSQMIQFMHCRCGEPLSAEEIAQSAGLKANYAIRLFKKLHGCGLIQYLTEIRLNAAQRALIMSDEKIINIAMDCGFNTLSRFYDAFRRRNGCSPVAYRKEHRPVSGTL
jgi:AraC-like DNA-binding protein